MAASASSTAAVCKSADNLKASIKGLKDINITANGTSAVSAQFTKIKQDFNTLKADAKGQYSPQVNALSGALDKLGSSLDAAKASLNAGRCRRWPPPRERSSRRAPTWSRR